MMPLQFMTPADEDLGPLARNDHDVVGDEAVTAFDQVEDGLALPDTTLPREQ
jgi:hypothetical protein